jgi:hypothetical protein
MVTVPSQHASRAARPAHSLAAWALRINGVFLLAVGLAACTADMLGYFYAAGPFAELDGQASAIASVEAHGLGALVGALIWNGTRSSEPWNRHALALVVHGFLMLCNLLYWKVYADLHIVPVGIVSTAAHALFFAVHLACLARGYAHAALPGWAERFRSAGLFVQPVAICTLLLGGWVHLMIAVLGRGALPLILTPATELLLSAPMFYVSIAGWLAWPQFRFRARWHRIAVAIILIYFPIGLPLHLMTITTGSTAQYAGIPEWYSLLIMPVMATFIALLAALHVAGAETGNK